MKEYVPKRGDLIVVTFDPQSGHEQKGRRPALVISNSIFNKATGLTVVCPITNTDRGIPFHIPIAEDSSLSGFIMTEQIKSIDYKSRRIKYIEKAGNEVLNEVLSILDACLYQNID